MNKLKKILACMIITLGILYLPEIHANASTVTIDEATFPDSCVRKFAQEQDVNKDGVLSDEVKSGKLESYKRKGSGYTLRSNCRVFDLISKAGMKFFLKSFHLFF